jgi:hypothetical protein
MKDAAGSAGRADVERPSGRPRKPQDRSGHAPAPNDPGARARPVSRALRAWVFASLVAGIVLTGCQGTRMSVSPTSPQRDIKDVLRDHDAEFMAISGVVGVYTGLGDDGRTPCIRVMLARRSPETMRAVPRVVEGYPVVIEVTGEIRPLESR